MNILVLGATGLLGSKVFNILNDKKEFNVYVTIRNENIKFLFKPMLRKKLILCEDILNQENLYKIFNITKPTIVINCISLDQKLYKHKSTLDFIPIYSLLPHRLLNLCSLNGARLIHISSDGVFSGDKGQYTEDEKPDASDIYGLSKILGEINVPHAITLRTSIIGHELHYGNGLISWFLSQQDSCICYSNVIFSGFPAVILAHIICDYVIPNPNLFGIYHIASTPISKFDLLKLVAKVYEKVIYLIPVKYPFCNRSLNPYRFQSVTGYIAPSWPEMIEAMHERR